jgi:hypothetical protein
MTENPVRTLMAMRRGSPPSIIILLCCSGCVLAGCSARRRPDVIPWATAVQVKPVTPEHPPETASVSDEPLPELRLELPPSPSRLINARVAPPKPRSVAPPSTASEGDPGKLGAPIIAPQLSAQESAVARQETNQSLGIAERNLESARGKRLNAAQLDLVSKIRGFIKDAREAAQIADWSRARSLAKKAQVLSEELASSL